MRGLANTPKLEPAWKSVASGRNLKSGPWHVSPLEGSTGREAAGELQPHPKTSCPPQQHPNTTTSRQSTRPPSDTPPPPRLYISRRNHELNPDRLTLPIQHPPHHPTKMDHRPQAWGRVRLPLALTPTSPSPPGSTTARTLSIPPKLTPLLPYSPETTSTAPTMPRTCRPTAPRRPHNRPS